MPTSPPPNKPDIPSPTSSTHATSSNAAQSQQHANGTTEQGTELRTYQYKKRPYAQACLACKSRKVRCVDADKPPCKACRVSRIACEFPERSVRRKRNPAPSTSSGSDQHAALEARLRRIEAALRLPPLESESEEEMEPPRFKLGGSDLTVFHGETSMHDDATDPSPKASNHPDSGGPPQIDAAWTPEDIRALTRLRHKYATADEGEAFIDAYFCWASPSIAVVNRSIFLRDMAVNGPFFSDLLLLVIYVSGLRFSPNIDAAERKAKNDRYMSIIMSLIAEELTKPSSIVTAQALLSLSGTRSAIGDQTMAWMLAGMGIRMIQDMGIHLAIDNPTLDAHHPQEIREMRVRLYWSAYIWDKTLALGMGREPTMCCRPDAVPEINLDEKADDWDWKPYFPAGDKIDLILRYPRRTSMTSFTLRRTIGLNLILENILVNMYSPTRPNARSVSFIRKTDESLLKWYAELPAAIKLERGKLPEFCPPTNISVLNLLYHTMRILLYRPLLTVRGQSTGVTASSLDVCRNASIDIHSIVALWGRTFGYVNMVYLIMYCVFVAAGVDVILLRIADAREREDALRRIQVGLQILEKASGQGPGIRRGIGIIATQLQAAIQQRERESRDGRESSRPEARDREAGRDREQRTDLREASARDGREPRNGVIEEQGQRRNAFAESSLRYEPFGQPPEGDSNVQYPFQAFEGSYTTELEPPKTFNLADLPLGDASAPLLFNDAFSQQALADLLGENHVGTEDPFAFLSSEGWDVRLS